jgi:hypothetical protein
MIITLCRFLRLDVGVRCPAPGLAIISDKEKEEKSSSRLPVTGILLGILAVFCQPGLTWVWSGGPLGEKNPQKRDSVIAEPSG